MMGLNARGLGGRSGRGLLGMKGLVWCAVALGVAVVASGAMAQNPGPAQPKVVQVQAGDTFSGVAAQLTGDARTWRHLFRPGLTGIRNPNLITVGTFFELAKDAKGARYLRVLHPDASPAAVEPMVSSPAPAVTTPSATVAAPAAPVAPAPARPAVAPKPAEKAAAVAPITVVPSGDELVVGVLPNIAAPALLVQYENLKRYLERVNTQKVRLVVPSTFKTFFDGSMNGEFDLAVSAPHFARTAQVDRGMVPLVMYEPRINALLVAPLDTPFTGPRDLREKAVAFANPQSLVAMYGRQWLSGQGLEPGRDYEVKSARSDLGVGRMLLSGDAVAAIMSNGEFRSLPQDEAARLRVVEVFAKLPNFVLLAHPRLGAERQAKLKAQLKAFLSDKEDGSAFAKATGVTNIIDADESQLRELDAHVPQTRKAMGYTK